MVSCRTTNIIMPSSFPLFVGIGNCTGMLLLRVEASTHEQVIIDECTHQAVCMRSAPSRNNHHLAEGKYCYKKGRIISIVSVYYTGAHTTRQPKK